MQTEVDSRRPSTESRAKYIRDSIRVRMLLEDLGKWDDYDERARDELSFGDGGDRVPAEN